MKLLLAQYHRIGEKTLFWFGLGAKASSAQGLLLDFSLEIIPGGLEDHIWCQGSNPSLQLPGKSLIH